jgi:hypothetical protein
MVLVNPMLPVCGIINIEIVFTVTRVFRLVRIVIGVSREILIMEIDVHHEPHHLSLDGSDHHGLVNGHTKLRNQNAS